MCGSATATAAKAAVAAASIPVKRTAATAAAILPAAAVFCWEGRREGEVITATAAPASRALAGVAIAFKSSISAAREASHTSANSESTFAVGNRPTTPVTINAVGPSVTAGTATTAAADMVPFAAIAADAAAAAAPGSF
jgi:hypothetical protein